MEFPLRRDSGFKTQRAGRATERQLEEMLTYMEQHPQFACARFVGKEGREAVSRQWQRLTNMLNSVPRGAYKDSKQWQTVWRDIKFNVSKKAGGGFKHQNSEGVGKMCSLTAIEMRTLDVMRMHCVEGTGGEQTKKDEASYMQDLIHQSADSPFEVVYVGSEKEALMEDATTPSDDSGSSRFPQLEKEAEEIVVMDEVSTNAHETHTTPHRSPEQCGGSCKSLLNLQEGFLKTQQMLAEASRHQAEAAALQAKTSMLHAENACKQTEMIDKISKLLEKQTANEERQMTVLGNLVGIIEKIQRSAIKTE
ncbi:uncharacterized protein [Anabrus simplex]|uniref:uncharacterized protein n=1 Tax=Anabrus simplex TaxID=316456 RepID=UPI0034DDB5D9